MRGFEGWISGGWDGDGEVTRLACEPSWFEDQPLISRVWVDVFCFCSSRGHPNWYGHRSVYCLSQQQLDAGHCNLLMSCSNQGAAKLRLESQVQPSQGDCPADEEKSSTVKVRPINKGCILPSITIERLPQPCNTALIKPG